MSGLIEIMSVSEGDIKATFEGDDKVIFHLEHGTEEKDLNEVVAKLEDMKKKGFSIMVKQENGDFVRAKGIDAETHEYVIKIAGTEVRQAIKDTEAMVMGQPSGG